MDLSIILPQQNKKVYAGNLLTDAFFGIKFIVKIHPEQSTKTVRQI